MIKEQILKNKNKELIFEMYRVILFPLLYVFILLINLLMLNLVSLTNFLNPVNLVSKTLVVFLIFFLLRILWEMLIYFKRKRVSILPEDIQSYQLRKEKDLFIHLECLKQELIDYSRDPERLLYQTKKIEDLQRLKDRFNVLMTSWIEDGSLSVEESTELDSLNDTFSEELENA